MLLFIYVIQQYTKFYGLFWEYNNMVKDKYRSNKQKLNKSFSVNKRIGKYSLLMSYIFVIITSTSVGY